MERYILGIDQSTQGTKALLFDDQGLLIDRADLPHRQIVDSKGWVEHDPEEIYRNTIQSVKNVVKKAGIDKNLIAGVGISNQRETALAWRKDGRSVYNAVVWQCARGAAICDRIAGCSGMIKERTGLKLSPYFSAAKIAWILENVEGAREMSEKGILCYGTIDSFLVYRLTGGKSYRTDYSNASRTQLFNIKALVWDEDICGVFGIRQENLPEVTASDGYYGDTDFEGFLETPIPIHGVLGDSHGALYGQGCLEKGMVKATYGTGSSVMMNVGDAPILSNHGLVSSIAWGMDGKIIYVLEGNINYTGAVISWMQNDLQIIQSASEAEHLAFNAAPEDKTYFVPAFTGMGAPYWDSAATGIFCGITRTTGKAEMVRAGLDCIAYQITDVIRAMEEDSGVPIKELCVDGGPTKNAYLMQFQSDIAGIPVQVPKVEELSGIGAAYAAGIGLQIYKKEELFKRIKKDAFEPILEKSIVENKYNAWKWAVKLVLMKDRRMSEW